MTYATGRLHAELAYLAYHLHWTLDDLLDLEHGDRRRWVSEVAQLTAAEGSGG